MGGAPKTQPMRRISIKIYVCTGMQRRHTPHQPDLGPVGSNSTPVFRERSIGCLIDNCAVLDTFVLEVALEELQPTRAKTLRQKTVRMVTSASFFTEWDQGPHDDLQPCGKMTVILPHE